MRVIRSNAAPILTSVLAMALMIGFPRRAAAGPGSYDPKSQQFNLTYTYATLPGVGVVGQPVPLDPARDKIVLSFVDQVSRYIQVATDGRGKIGSFQPVDSAERADVVISPDNDSDRAAWATPGGLGKEGHVFIYYKYLADPSRPVEGVALTAAHELCHYFFGLPDEYPDVSDGQPTRHCPANPSGDGCLMDNYWSRPWYQRLCDQDHNNTVASQRLGLRYRDSCKSLVDTFFAARGVTSGTGAGQGPANQADTETAKLHSIVQSATAEVQKNINKPTVTLPILRRFARELVQKGLGLQNLTRTEGEISKAVETIIKAASLVAMPPPARFKALATALLGAAVRLASQGKAADDASRIAAVKTELMKLALQKAPPDTSGGPYKEDDLQFLESLARRAVLAPPDDQGQPKDAAGVNYQLLRFLFEAVRDLSADTNPAISRAMSDRIRQLDQLGREFGLPVPVKPRFGTRRTMIIAPNPRPGTPDLVPLQSGIFSYTTMRDLYLTQFAKLIQRNQIQFNKIDLRQRIESRADEQFGITLPGAAPRTIFTPRPDASEAAPQPPPSFSVGQLLGNILDEIRKDQLENVAVLIPPGGLPENVNDLLRAFRDEELVRKSDIRLDLVVVGSQPVPSLLLDLCERSGGVVLTISDIHETGAVAQRLKNEESAGAWVAFPRQFDLPCGKGVDWFKDLLVRDNPDFDLPRYEKVDYFYLTRRSLLPSRISEKDWKDGEDTLPPWLRIRKEDAKDARVTIRENLAEVTRTIDGMRKRTLADVNKPKENLRDIYDIIQRLDEDYQKVLRLFQQLAPIADLIAGQFQAIPEAAQERKRRAALVMADIVRGKRILLEIERNYRSALGQDLDDLKASLAVKPPDDEDVKKLEDLLEALGAKGNTLYNGLYGALRLIERGITQVIQPVNARLSLATFQEQVRALDRQESLTIRNLQISAAERRYRIPFYGEEDAEFEVVIGLSHIPPFTIPTQEAIYGTRELVQIQLLDEQGNLSTYHDALKVDEDASTKTTRVYRLPKVPGRHSQWYQLQVVPNLDYAGALLEDTVRYTVSIASLRPNVELTTGIVYPPDPHPPAAEPKKRVGAGPETPATALPMRGTFSALLPGPVVEIQVYGGTAILGATVKGIYQVLGAAGPLNQFPSFEFKDDGIAPDRARNDGVYTYQIPLDGTPKGGADYRIAIQAFATQTRDRAISNVALEPSDTESKARQDENAKAGKKLDADEQQDAPPLQFQRTTTLHFRAER